MNAFVKSLQYFFWLLAGSDIELLEKNPTEKNRHANIGLAIFTTTFVAFITGTLAGYQFSPHSSYKWLAALFFGFIWSLLVFTIDRNMVLTLKKDPTKEKQNLVVPIAYRVFLSALISFFISIPLELWIFKEEIAIQMNDDDDKKLELKQERLSRIYGLGALTQEKANIQQQNDSLTALNNLKEPTTIEYRNAKIAVDQAKEKYRTYNAAYSAKVEQRKEIHSQWADQMVISGKKDTLASGEIIDVKERIGDLPLVEQTKFKDDIYDSWWEIFKETRENPDGPKTIERNRLKKVAEDLESKKTDIFNAYYLDIEIKQKRGDSLLAVTNKELKSSESKVDSTATEYADLIQTASGFTSQWIALNNLHIVEDDALESEKAEAFWILFFIWFIRLVFFTIELLPTLAKVTTPVGAYDWALYEEERKQKGSYKKKTNQILKEQDHDIELNMEEKELLKKQQLENLKENILKNYFDRQNRLADKILEKWEKEELMKMGDN